VVDEDGRRVGVVEDVGDFVRGEPMVHRHADGAERAEGRDADEVLQRVVGVHDRVLTDADAERRQRVGEAIPRSEKLFPCERARALDEGRPVRVLCGVRGDDVHGWQSVPLGGPACAPQPCEMATSRRDSLRRLQPLLQVVILAFALFCLGIAQEVFIPIASAMLLTFVLSPIVERLERWRFPRVVAVVMTVLLVSTVLAGVGWLLASQVTTLAADLPQYRSNLTAK